MTGFSLTEFGAWSTWSLDGGDGDRWAGSLIVTASPTTDEKVVVVDIERQ